MDIWMRDIAPVIVIKEGPGNGTLAGLDYNFNGWGGKYPTPTTRELARKILMDLGIERIETSMATGAASLLVAVPYQ
ncbi:hypothetical protein J3459_017517 [Metarhizium acridum]|uniref:uncharacterized protein n=1 Tax=Metarhizium acridum TaxID=92637 RepID=UPI001C6C5C3E|nr:hypothetical protein J3458_021455 [Metarhizium acridum]KAG8409414.1 hypothetical protein J3459_017517 [Metarhizium acridum]